MRALIVEQGASRGAVAAARALAAAGWFVGVGSPRGRGLAASSGACSARHDVGAAHDDLTAFVAGVRAAIEQRGYDVVFGAGEAEVLALSSERATVTGTVPYAPHATVLAALDKAELERRGAAAGFAVPRVLAADELAAVTGPVVLKGRQHAAPQRPGSPPRIDTLVVFGADAVRRRLDELRALGAEPIGQEYVTGELLAYSAVTDRDAEVGADSMQVASRIWPPYAGASCRAVTVQVDETIATKARALFLDLGWFGLAELQFVVPADGRPRLIDFNGRFYGSLALAVAAGANLPAIWAALASGRRVRRTRARPGVRYQWLEGDLRRAGRERRGGLLRDGVTTIASAGSATHSLWSWRDPWPALQRGRAALGEATFGAGR